MKLLLTIAAALSLLINDAYCKDESAESALFIFEQGNVRLKASINAFSADQENKSTPSAKGSITLVIYSGMSTSYVAKASGKLLGVLIEGLALNVEANFKVDEEFTVRFLGSDQGVEISYKRIGGEIVIISLSRKQALEFRDKLLDFYSAAK